MIHRFAIGQTGFGVTTTAIATAADINISAGSTSINSSAFTFANSNGVTFGIDTNAQITASVDLAGAMLISAGSLSTIRSDVTFSNSNGVTFGLNTNGVITATVATNYQSPGAYLTTAMASDRGTDFVQATAGFHGTNASGTIASSGISVSVAAPSNNSINISAGTTSSNVTAVTFSNGSGVSFGFDGSNITATVATNYQSPGAYLTTAALSQDSSKYAGTGFTTATTAGTAVVGTLSTNGLSMGVPAFLTTAAVAPTPLSYFANFFNLPNYVISMNQSNSFYVAPITVPFNISISYLRFLGSASFTSTTIATSGVNNATGASTAFSETIAHNVVLYTVGTGASSRSLQEVYSTSAGLTWAVSVSQASTSNASNQSITQRMTYPIEGFTTSTFSTQYSVSTSNGPISTTQFSLFSNQKYLDIPFATSLSAGNYWLALNRITGTVGGKNMDYGISTVGTSQSLVTWGLLGLAANVSNPFIYGLGVWTTNVAQTTASIAFNAITMTQSYFLPFVNFINQA